MSSSVATRCSSACAARRAAAGCRPSWSARRPRRPACRRRTVYRWLRRASDVRAVTVGLGAARSRVRAAGDMARQRRRRASSAGRRGHRSCRTCETLRRAIARELSLAQRDYITDGDDGLRARTVYLRHEARFRGECYEGDHKQLSIEVLAPRATRAAAAVGDAVRRSVLAADRGLGAVAAADRGRGPRGRADGRRRGSRAPVRRRAGSPALGSRPRVRRGRRRAGRRACWAA